MHLLRKIRSIVIAGLLLLSHLGSVWAGQALAISLLAASPSEGELPLTVPNTGTWESIAPGPMYRMYLQADRELLVGGMAAGFCERSQSQGLSVDVHPREQRFQEDVAFKQDPDTRGFTLRRAHAGPASARLERGQSIRARSIQVHAAPWPDCVTRLDILDPQGEPYALRLPRTVPGKVAASTAAAPAATHDGAMLFDSRIMSGWASGGQGVGAWLEFSFKDPQTIRALGVWNGHQRSETHWHDSGRVKRWRVEGEGGYLATVTVMDTQRSQHVWLPAPFTGKRLRLTAMAVHPGKRSADLAVSELRFFDGKGWFLIDPHPRLRQIGAANRAALAHAKMGAALDRKLSGSLAAREHTGSNHVEVRLRPDGTFHLHASYELIHPTAKERCQSLGIRAQGNYEVLGGRPGRADLRLFGLVEVLDSRAAGRIHSPGGGICAGDEEFGITPQLPAVQPRMTASVLPFTETLRFAPWRSEARVPGFAIQSIAGRNILIPKSHVLPSGVGLHLMLEREQELARRPAKTGTLAGR